MELVERDLDENISVPISGEVGASRRYYVVDSSVDPSLEDVLDFLNESLPRNWGQLRLTSFSPQRIGKGLYEVDVEYGLQIRRFTGVPALESNTGPSSYTFSFSTGGATYQTKVAKEQTAYGTAPALVGNLINWNGQTADGVDIVGPRLQVTIRKRMVGAIITLAYIRTIVNLTGKTNHAVFMQFAPGELLFLGADGSMVPGADTELTFNFAASPNVSSATIDGQTVTDIGGHDYIWSFVLPGSQNIPDVKGVYKARLYDSGDFTQLRI